MVDWHLTPGSEGEQKEIMMVEKLATADEVADFLGYTKAGLAQMRYRGTGPKFVKLGGIQVRYRWAEVEAWIDRQTRDRTGVPA